MPSDDRGIADAMYTMMSVAIVMILAIAVSGVVLSTTMKQGTAVSSQVSAYDTEGMRKGISALYFAVDPAVSDFASGDPNQIVLKSSGGENIDKTIAFSPASAPGTAPGEDGCVIWTGYVYAPADGTVIAIGDVVLNGRPYGSRIDIQPTTAPSLVVSVSPVRVDPALVAGSTVAAGATKLGSLVDLSRVEHQALAHYTNDAGNHVVVEVHPSASLGLG